MEDYIVIRHPATLTLATSISTITTTLIQRKQLLPRAGGSGANDASLPALLFTATAAAATTAGNCLFNRPSHDVA